MIKNRALIYIIYTVAVLFIVSVACWRYFFYHPQNTQNYHTGDYLGSEYQGNYIWAGAMNLAWNELTDNILHEKLQLQTKDQVALDVADKFNQSPFSKKDLDEKSYYARSGYGQYAINLINQEVKTKFPSKSFGDLSLNLNPHDIVSYAYFFKQVEYPTVFYPKEITFLDTHVQGFYADTDDQKDNIKILQYWNDDKFIISLQLKDNQDQIIVAKGFDMTSPQDMIDKINIYPIDQYQKISYIDEFAMPKMHLKYHREYNELLNIPLANRQFTDYAIEIMYENINFDIDQVGAKVENEAVIGKYLLGAASSSPAPIPKQLILDKPFWLLMKRTDSQNPYFVLGVNNTNFMEVKN